MQPGTESLPMASAPSHAEQEQPHADDGIAMAGVRLSHLNGWLLIPMKLKPQIVVGATPAPVPGTPSWFRGYLNLNGALAPAFDLSLFSGAKPAGDCFVVIADAEGVIAICSDAPPTMLKIRRNFALMDTQAPADPIWGEPHAVTSGEPGYIFDPSRWLPAAVERINATS